MGIWRGAALAGVRRRAVQGPQLHVPITQPRALIHPVLYKDRSLLSLPPSLSHRPAPTPPHRGLIHTTPHLFDSLTCCQRSLPVCHAHKACTGGQADECGAGKGRGGLHAASMTRPRLSRPRSAEVPPPRTVAAAVAAVALASDELHSYHLARRNHRVPHCHLICPRRQPACSGEGVGHTAAHGVSGAAR